MKKCGEGKKDKRNGKSKKVKKRGREKKSRDDEGEVGEKERR